MLHQPTGRKGRSPQRHKYPQECHRIVPSSSQPSPTIWGHQCGPDDRDCHTHTHNLAEPLFPRRSRHHWPLQCTRARHRDGVDMPDAGLHPHREPMHKQHTEPMPSCCVPFSDPHVHNVTPSYNTRQECSHSSANTMGPVHHMARTHQTDDQSKGRTSRGYISKEFCANTGMCPLASPRVALAGVRLLRHPDKGNTR